MSVSLAQLKTYMRKSLDEHTDDPLLQEVLDAAEGVVSHRTGGADLAAPLRVLEHRGLLILPIARVHGIATLTDPAGVQVDVDTVQADLEAGVIDLGWRRPVRPGVWEIEVTADADGAAPLALAVKIIAEHLWSLRRGTAGVGARAGAQARTDSDTPVIPIGYAVPNRAAELIAPYSLALGFA